ncbi:MAG: hypothetical protein IKH94_05210 [Eubacterium sp.]|nr:hypothetical protein [Eubacterium sp.]
MKSSNLLFRFFGGLALMAVGLFLLFNRVHVGSGFGGFGGRLGFGFFSIPSGLVVVPFIISIVWMFASEGSFISKIFTVLSVLFILAAIIMNTTFWVDRMTMFDWLLMLVMIFGGGGMVASVLFKESKSDAKKNEEDLEMYKDIAASQAKKASELEKELAAVKKQINNKTNV